MCHICSHIKKVPKVCEKCKSFKIDSLGIGSQQLEKEVGRLFPKAKTIRIDSDSLKHKDKYKIYYDMIKNNKVDIIIGTQIIAKGLDIENVNLIGVVLADIGLSIPDYVTSENIYNLIVQVSGRTSRKEDKGEVIIQTYNPDNPILRFAIKSDYKKFYEYEIKERERYNYPPFSHISKIIIQNFDKQKAKNKAYKIYKELKKYIKAEKMNTDIYITIPLIFKKFKKYTYNIILKDKNNKNIENLLSKIKISSKIKIDRDPISLTN